MKKYLHFISTTVLIVSHLVSFCQDEKIVLLSKYTQTQGLSSYYVTKIIKDAYGFMWVGTQEGLNLFDGNSFQVFSKQAEEKKRLGASFISDLVEDKKRALLWVLTAYGNICGIDLKTRIIKKRLNVDKDNQALSGKWIRSLAIHGDTLWFGGLGVISGYNIETDSFITVAMPRGGGIAKTDWNIAKIAVDNQSRLWLFCDGSSIVILNKSLQVVQTFTSQLYNDLHASRKLRFWEIAFYKDQLYVGTSLGMRRFEIGENGVTYLKNTSHTVIDTAEVLSLAFISSGQLLFSTPNGFWSTDLITNKTYTYHDQDLEDDWLTLTYQVYYDSLAQKIWVGTQSGLASFDGRQTAFNIFSRSSKSSARIRHAFSLMPVDNDKIYCGDENGLFQIKTATKEIEKIDNGSSNLMLFKDQAGQIFLSNKSGFYLIKGKKLFPIHAIYPSLKLFESDQFNCAAQFNDSVLVFGSVIQKGLSVWNNRTGDIKIFHNDSALNSLKGLTIINNLFKSNSGSIFILTEKSIIDFNPLTGKYLSHAITADKVSGPILNLMDMCETSESYWIATYGDGIIETDKNFNIKKKFSTLEGLGNNCAYKIFSCKNTSILVTTNNGLSAIDCKTYKIQKYFQSDGLHSNNFEQVCGYQTPDKIYAGGVNGFTIIDPDILFSNPTPPQLYINKISIQTSASRTDTSNIFLKELEIPSNVVQVTISLSGLNFRNPGRTSYAYKINKDQSEWVDLGTQNFVDLPPLPPGKYMLAFRSANEAGVWIASPVTLSLFYLPKWYQTSLFKVILIACVITFVYLLYKYRISQIAKENLIRKNIASDLHDDIGSTLNTVKVFTHLAKGDLSSSKYLDEIENALTDATMGLRDMIWVLDDTADMVTDLIDRIKKFSIPVTSACNIRFECVQSADWKNYTLSKTEKRNLLLMFKEIVNNSIKYAECRSIKISFSVINDEKNIQVSDDGKGFNIILTRQGNGLKNLHYRAKQMGYKVEVASSNERGTIVTIKKG